MEDKPDVTIVYGCDFILLKMEGRETYITNEEKDMGASKLQEFLKELSLVVVLEEGY